VTRSEKEIIEEAKRSLKDELYSAEIYFQISRMFKDSEFVLEYGIKADFSLVKCDTADRYGNLLYHATARNFGPIMCTAAKITIVQARSIVDAGQIDPEIVITPGIYVKKVVEINNPANESKLVADEMRYPW